MNELEMIRGMAGSIGSLLEQVGAYQMQSQKEAMNQISFKSTGIDCVTQVDQKSDQWLFQGLSELLACNYLGEEMGFVDRGSDLTWVVDPLDGTTNYTQGLPLYGISVGLKKGDIPIAGFVYMPVFKDLYWAILGRGAFLNDLKINVSTKTTLSEAVLATGFPYDRALSLQNNADNFAHLIPQVRGIRRLGAAAYDMVLTASGVLDGYWELNLKEWDALAGRCIIKEAGGVIYPLQQRGVSLIAGSQIMVDLIKEQLITK